MVLSHDDGHIVVQNMYRKVINIQGATEKPDGFQNEITH
jgi:hypothetical protein